MPNHIVEQGECLDIKPSPGAVMCDIQRRLKVTIQRLAVQVRVHEPQPAQAALAGAGAAHVGQLEAARVADDHRLDVALAVEEHADLAVRLVRDLAEVPRQLGRDDRAGVDAAAVGAAEGVELGGLEAEGVPEDVLHSVPQA